MQRVSLFLILAVVMVANAVGATRVINPTTTLTAETGNNTSTADSFTAQANGNTGAGNVSKLPIASLLYSGANTKIYAHYMPWFGGSNHMNVGYNSTDARQIKRQVDDMMSRGISGAIIDWYGPSGNQANQSSLAMMLEAENRNGQFEFALMEDEGSIRGCADVAACTTRLLTDLNYAYRTFEGSPAYMRIDGRPVVFYFDVTGVDWDQVRAGVSGNPLFIKQNSGAFTKPQSDGGFSWIAPQDVTSADPMAMSYLKDFYATAMNFASSETFGSAYKGFDDSLAAWGSNRKIGQQCGKTWLATMNAIGAYHSPANQLPRMQLVTWNDYEEATALEMGIDNCLNITASANSTNVSWSISGSDSGEATIDHYTLFLSQDGEKLMPIADVPVGTNSPVGTRSFDISKLGFAAGAYTVYVKAVGKPSILNKMSNATSITVAGALPPVIQFNVSPRGGAAPVMVTASTVGSTDRNGGALSSTLDFGDGYVTGGSTASHTYSRAGSYTVRGTVTTSAGLSATASDVITVTVPVIPAAVTITSPANGSSISGAQVRVTATATAPAGIVAMQAYIDNTKIYLGNGGTMDALFTLSPGIHRLVVQGWDAKGAVYESSLSFTMVAPVIKTLTILSPAPNAVVTTLAQVVANATAPATIVAMQIYVDGALAFQVNNTPQLNQKISLSRGSHQIAVKAWDVNGTNWMSAVSVTAKP